MSRTRMPAALVLLALTLWLAFFAAPLPGLAAEPGAAAGDAIVREQASQLDTTQIENYWNKLMKQYGGYFPEIRVPSLMELLAGGQRLQLDHILKGLLRYLFHEIIVSGKLLGSIMVLTVFSILLETLQSSFERNTVSKIAYAISFMVLVIIAVNSFSVAIGYAKTAIADMIQFMLAIVPLLLTLLASTGGVASVTILHPMIVFMVHTVGTAIYLIVFPLLFFSAVLHMVSSITDKYKVTQLADLLRNVSIGALGAFVTVFLGVISVQSTSGAIADGVAVRTAKYVTSTFVPVVGRMFSDASETVIGASMLVKNAVGLVGVVIILLLCAFPALKIITLALIYNVSGAMLQPLGNSPMIKCLQTIGKSLIAVFAALAVVGLMFFLAITMMITAGNMTLLAR
nr:stage III sporulation protein AE [Paenibacillus sp. VKM B-2647]